MNSDDVIRSFIAIEISDEVRVGLRALQQNLKKVGARVGWVAPENIHLTVVFLGDVFRSQVERLANVLDDAAAQTNAFRYEVAGSGFFGSPRSPRVIWAGLNAPTYYSQASSTATMGGNGSARSPTTSATHRKRRGGS